MLALGVLRSAQSRSSTPRRLMPGSKWDSGRPAQPESMMPVDRCVGDASASFPVDGEFRDLVIPVGRLYLCVDFPDTAVRFTMKRWACDLIDVPVDNGSRCLSHSWSESFTIKDWRSDGYESARSQNRFNRHGGDGDQLKGTIRHTKSTLVPHSS